MKRKKTIGIIGFGNMGSSIGRALKEKDWRVYIYDKDKSKSRKEKDIFICKNYEEIIKIASIMIIAIKPQDISGFIDRVRPLILKYKPLIISIAAGVSTAFFEKMLKKARVIRVMPNLAAKKRLSISFISPGQFAKDSDIKLAREIFNCIGESIIIKESFLDKVTAISGSGPGYVYYFMDSLYESALLLGFRKDVAKKIVFQTFWGAINLIKDQKENFKAWIKKVASKGGTTQAALDVWERNNFKNLFKKAIKAAYARAKELNLKD
jgi:pyrroline-5-carboxylate reductase